VPEAQALFTNLLEAKRFMEAAELLAMQKTDAIIKPLSSEDLLIFSLRAGQTAIMQLQFTDALMLLRLAHHHLNNTVSSERRSELSLRAYHADMMVCMCACGVSLSLSLYIYI
jgi:hypothetical protein